MTQNTIRQVAVLGAGVMGAQIAAHFANAGIAVTLFDLPGKGNDKNAVVNKAIAGLKKLKPAPLGDPSVLKRIIAANYEEHLPLLKKADLIVEAVAERMDIKKAVYDQVAPHVGQNAIFATNTSGLSIGGLANALPEALRNRFCGVHFFNPPRYMHLVEIIPTQDSAPEMLARLEQICTQVVGKGVVFAKDTPNFIANRVGVFSMLSTIHHGMANDIPFETVDALTGPLLGRPKSATYRTADVVGLDTMAHVIGTMQSQLDGDPWHGHYAVPEFLQKLIEAGALGQKTRKGIYQKVSRDIQVIDPASGDYRASNAQIEPEVLDVLKSAKPTEKLLKLRSMTDSAQAQFLWALHRDLFHYCAVHLAEIADTTRDVDFAIRWGYGWALGPFETWQISGWDAIADAIREDIAAGKTMAKADLPDWVSQHQAHSRDGAFSAETQTMKPRSDAPVYLRQAYPDKLISEHYEYGETIFENDEFRLWHRGEDVAIASFKTKKHVISAGVLEGLQESVERAEADYKGLVIWQTEEPFTLGANLAPAAQAIAGGQVDQVEKMVDTFQQTSQKLRFSQVPTIVAARGMTLGGGCEFSMNATALVAAFESYIGLVEAGVGLLPAGGGLKEIARRVASVPLVKDAYPLLEHYFKTVAMASVATSALEAVQWRLVKPNTTIVMHPHELLHVATHKARYLHDRGYLAPAEEQKIAVGGRPAIANMRMILANMIEGHMISEHDYAIADRIAKVICGDEVDAGTEVHEQYLLDLERKYFMELIQMPKTLARIEHTLKTGKPLRN